MLSIQEKIGYQYKKKLYILRISRNWGNLMIQGCRKQKNNTTSSVLLEAYILSYITQEK